MLAAIGDVIVRGGVPYRDGWDMKGPLPYYGFALAQWLFGRHMWSIRILDLPLLLAGIAALATAAGRVASRVAGWWAALAFAIWIGSLTWFHTIQPDTWAANFILLAAAPLIARRPSPRQLLFAGFMIGCAVLVKPLYLGFAAVPLVQILAQDRSEKRPPRLSLAAAVAGIALAPPLLAVAWFAYRGALRDLVDVHLLYALRVYSGGGLHAWDVLRSVLKYFLTGNVKWALPVIAAGGYALWRRSRTSALTALAWIAVALLCVAAQAKFYKYHWIPLFPPLLLLGAAGFQWLLLVVSDRTVERAPVWVRAIGGLALPLALFGFLQAAATPTADIVKWLKLMAGSINASQYYASYTAGHFSAGDAMNASRHIRERTIPAEGLVVWGNEALLNFLSGRANPTRFVFSLPLTEGGSSPVRALYRSEYIAGLQRNLPAYFVAGTPWSAGTKEHVLHGFPELEVLLNEHYSLETRIGYLDIYSLNRSQISRNR